MQRGILYFTQKEYELAIWDFLKAIEINPNNNFAYVNLSAIHCAQTKYELALKDCDNAIRIDPSYQTAHKNRGRINYLLSNLGEKITIEYTMVKEKEQCHLVMNTAKSMPNSENKSITNPKLLDKNDDNNPSATSNLTVSAKEQVTNLEKTVLSEIKVEMKSNETMLEKKLELTEQEYQNKVRLLQTTIEQQNKQIAIMATQIADLSKQLQPSASTNTGTGMTQLITQHSPVFKQPPKSPLNQSSELSLNENNSKVSVKKII